MTVQITNKLFTNQAIETKVKKNFWGNQTITITRQFSPADGISIFHDQMVMINYSDHKLNISLHMELIICRDGVRIIENNKGEMNELSFALNTANLDQDKMAKIIIMAINTFSEIAELR